MKLIFDYDGKQHNFKDPDADGFVIIKAGTVTVAVYKTQVWYLKMPGEVPRMSNY